MRHRDWDRGEDGPRERRTVAPWDEPADPPPVDRYAAGTGVYRTPSRRRAIERGQQEPVEAYLPRWALESGVRSADGGGRHAAPDDENDRADDYEPERPWSGGWRGTETTSTWRRGGEPARRELPAIGAAPAPLPEPQSDHTREWTFDRPQDQGYVGSRRADDGPVSGVAGPQSRPRRSPSRQPQVVWSGLDDADEVTGAVAEVERPTRRSRRVAEAPPAVDPWERGARRSAEPAPTPEVDPWDASGVYAWRPAGEPDRWDGSVAGSRWNRPDDTGQWDRPDDTGRWDRPDDTGQWDRPDDTGQWYQPDGTGPWERVDDIRQRDGHSGDVGWDRAASPRSGGGSGRGWPERDEGFWPGTRLAGDDPRWVDPPSSAPRSPVVGYTAPRPRAAPRRRPEPVGGGARGVAAAGVRRRIDPVGAGAWSRRLEDDLLDPDPGGPWRPLLYTAACYLLPAMVVFLWLLTLDGQAPAGCVTDISGGGCDSPRSRALGSLAEALPRLGLALASSLVVALLLRRVGTTWRSVTVAAAAAVVGGGLSTVMISAVTGQPIG
ncbi:hypothetical protein [Micromonospora endolithica]|uniref:Uncharacterized protein n=1 Tax=Micromonospora endolithica TaxID=230091 RepID=A0A3A9ZDS3_9ACTN|nr:hypothetical protein [Micromonospora endolithica]RKN46305.1 hypothetical protein D7223_15410 [Micromonospora endolithica]TWJ24964.1 hypothetical protein JD76_05124 [Micromonospora endolithica]